MNVKFITSKALNLKPNQDRIKVLDGYGVAGELYFKGNKVDMFPIIITKKDLDKNYLQLKFNKTSEQITRKLNTYLEIGWEIKTLGSDNIILTKEDKEVNIPVNISYTFKYSPLYVDQIDNNTKNTIRFIPNFNINTPTKESTKEVSVTDTIKIKTIYNLKFSAINNKHSFVKILSIVGNSSFLGVPKLNTVYDINDVFKITYAPTLGLEENVSKIIKEGGNILGFFNGNLYYKFPEEIGYKHLPLKSFYKNCGILYQLSDNNNFDNKTVHTLKLTGEDEVLDEEYMTYAFTTPQLPQNVVKEIEEVKPFLLDRNLLIDPTIKGISIICENAGITGNSINALDRTIFNELDNILITPISNDFSITIRATRDFMTLSKPMKISFTKREAIIKESTIKDSDIKLKANVLVSLDLYKIHDYLIKNNIHRKVYKAYYTPIFSTDVYTEEELQQLGVIEFKLYNPAFKKFVVNGDDIYELKDSYIPTRGDVVVAYTPHNYRSSGIITMKIGDTIDNKKYSDFTYEGEDYGEICDKTINYNIIKNTQK